MLFIDKIILGLLISVALIFYRRWETIDTRKYEEVNRNTDLIFKRAEYAKDFLPLVIDDSEESIVRIQSLSVLIDTNAIPSSSCIILAQQLLQSDVLDYKQFLMSREEIERNDDSLILFYPESLSLYFQSIVQKSIPSGISEVVSSYKSTSGALQYYLSLANTDESSMEKATLYYLIRRFWRSVFTKTINDNLAFIKTYIPLLDSKTFLIGNLPILFDLAQPSLQDAQNWANTSVLGLKLIGNLQILRKSNRYDKPAKYIAEIIQLPKTKDDILLSSKIFTCLFDSRIEYLPLSKTIFQIALSDCFDQNVIALPHEIYANKYIYFYNLQKYLFFLLESTEFQNSIFDSIYNQVIKLTEKIKTSSPEDIASTFDDTSMDVFFVKCLMKMYTPLNTSRNKKIDYILNPLFSIDKNKLDLAFLSSSSDLWKDRLKGIIVIDIDSLFDYE